MVNAKKTKIKRVEMVITVVFLLQQILFNNLITAQDE